MVYFPLYVATSSMTLPGQSLSKKGKYFKPDAQELVLSDNPAYACETYIFDPSTGEEHLGYLFAAAETEDRGGVGKELLDLVIAAVQNEYYRDSSRSCVHSFELALHQANLILHDSAERGVKDWMGYFNVAIGVLSGEQLHVSVAGEASCWLTRKGVITNVSEGLSHLPITNPLRAFSQVASGELKVRDTIFFTTANFEAAFRPQDAARFTIDHSAQTISARLQQLYQDQQQKAPLSLVTVSVLPEYVVQPREEISLPSNRTRSNAQTSSEQLRPRKPLQIRRSGFQQALVNIGGLLASLVRWLKNTIWPLLRHGGAILGTGAVKGGSALWTLSKNGGKQIINRQRPAISQDVPAGPREFTAAPSLSIGARFSSFLTFMRRLPAAILYGVINMPLTSKIFASLAVVLLIGLFASLHFLQSKRVADQEIQRASEKLHDAQTKVDAAQSALLSNNRTQAEQLLAQASKEVDELKGTTLYVDETKKLEAAIMTQSDRLQKITRATGSALKIIGDFASKTGNETLTHLFKVDNTFYTYNPKTNAILAMNESGEVTIASDQTKEIGSFVNGVAHTADKTIFFVTNGSGMALFDAKDNSLSKQDIQLSGDKPSIAALALFGNRMYTYEPALKTIVTYNKTLRGFSSGTPWITDTAFPASSIRSFAVDGSVYVLLTDGTVRELFKGVATDFSADKVSPALTSATTLITNEDMQNIYVLDAEKHRIILFTKKGALIKQIFFDANLGVKDMTINPAEDTLYLLAGTQVVSIPLKDPAPPK